MAENNEPTRPPTLTERQREIYDYLREMIVSRGYGPTVREIGLHFKIGSPNGVMSHLKALEKKGLITRDPGMSRAIQLTEPPQPQAALMLAGQLNAGHSLELISDPQTRIEFAGLFASKQHCCIRVIGHGLLEDHIAEGDYLALRRQADCRDGELILVTIDGGAPTVKRYYRESNHIRLESLNRRLPPVFATKIKIHGLVVGVLRQY
jgi:repressor LexA